MAASPLDPEIVAAVAGLSLTPRRQLAAGLQGGHLAMRRGNQGEFRELRAYVPGDDVRRLDWRAYGKTDRYSVRLYDQEAHHCFYLVVDASASMGFGSAPRRSKLEVARRLALAIAWLATRQGDAVGLQVAAEAPPSGIAAVPRPAALAGLMHRLAALQPRGATRLVAALQRLQRAAAQPGSVLLFSDLFDDDPALLGSLGQLTRRGHAVTVVQLLDPDELRLPEAAPGTWQSMEGPQTLFVDAFRQGVGYRQRMQQFLERCTAGCADVGVRHLTLCGDRPLRELLVAMLHRRH